MIKKMVSVLAATSILLAFPATVFAQNHNKVDLEPIYYPLPIWRTFETKPGQPFHLKGCGLLRAEGKGLLKYTNVRGYINVSGKGLLGVEKDDVSKVRLEGFKKKTRIGQWIIFIGRGRARAWGVDLDIFFHGKGKTYALGCGKVSFWGKWVGRYIRFRVKPTPPPIDDLQLPPPIAN